MSTLTMPLILEAAKEGGFQGDDVYTAAAIAMAESGGDPLATHKNSDGSTDYGLFQINSSHTDLINQSVIDSGFWQDSYVNAHYAYTIFKQSGFQAWTTYNNGAYKKYVTVAKASQPAGKDALTTQDKQVIPVTDEDRNQSLADKAKDAVTNLFGNWSSWISKEIKVVGVFLIAVLLIGFALFLIARPAINKLPKI